MARRAFALVFLLGLMVAPTASANFEQVGTFADSTETPKLEGATSMAVNVTGAGGVPAGTFYAVTSKAGSGSVRRYNAKGEFREAWGWAVSNPPSSYEFERCGPDGEAAHPTCGVEGGNTGESLGQMSEPQGVAVDQATGNVYVLNSWGRKHSIIQVFNADGSQLIASFGDGGLENENLEEGPEKIHTVWSSGIAVDASGAVYVSDLTHSEPSETRVMVFRPQSPGDYEHYVYAGRENDIAADHDGIRYVPQGLALDDAGDLFIRSEGLRIYKFAHADGAAPICQYQVPGGGAGGMTVNPSSGEVFYFSSKDRKIHQLSACDAQGEFEEIGAFSPTVKTSGIEALAINQTLAWGPSHPPGVLYAGDALQHSSPEGTIFGLGDIFAPAEVRLPVVESESVSSVTAVTALLGAQINPKGSETRYAFQYLSEDAYQANEPADRFAGASEVPLGGGVLGTGQSALSASVAVSGLLPDTSYRYRAIATSHCEPDDEEELCEDAGDAESFHTFPAQAPGLPDNRAYELVSPPHKQGGEVIPTEPGVGRCGEECKPETFGNAFPMQSAPGGEAVVYEGTPFSLGGAVRLNEYLAKRTPSGWQTETLSPLLQIAGLQGYKAFDAGLTQGLIYQTYPQLSPEAPSGYPNLYTQPSANPPALESLIRSEPPNRPAGNSFRATYAGASADLSQIFFAANDALSAETPFAPEALDGGASKNNLYESVGGQLRLVNVLPGNTETVPGAVFGSGTQLAFETEATADVSHAISADGTRAFWSDEGGQVYVREDGERPTEIPGPGKFLTASADGSQVLLSNGHLYDLQTESTVDLSAGKGGFEGILGQSEDLSHIYFVDTAVLSGEEENERGDKAQEGAFNLYAWQEGTTTFIGRLSPPAEGSGAPDNQTRFIGGDWRASLATRTAEASPDGRWVAFLSKAPLTGYENSGPACIVTNRGELKGGLCFEVFLYDSATAKLICASCNPSGAGPLGRSNLRLIESAEGSMTQPRYLTDSGRLYFDSQDSLVPSDTNDGIEDVYQYEPQGVGGCNRQDGCTSLISAGHEPIDSNFLATDESGKSVFFTTRDQLVLKDTDDLIDLYVAREGGGLAAETETARSECQGEACAAAISPPNDGIPASASVEGAGNVVEKPVGRKHHRRKKKHVKKAHRKHPHQRAVSHGHGGAK